MGEAVLCPFLQRYIAELRRHPRGYSYASVRSSIPDDCAGNAECPAATGDRFTVHVPYCRGYLHWEVLFNSERPEQAPDLVLEDVHTPWFELSRCPALLHWTPDASFATLLDEVLAQYRSYHEGLVRTHPNERLRFEYHTICGASGVDYEVRAPSVRLMIPLAVDLDPVFRVLLASPWSGEQCHYFVEFTAPPDRPLQVAASELHWPPALLPLAWLVDHPFPAFTLASGGCLVQFLPALEASIADLVATYLERHAARQALCQALVAAFGTPWEYDPNLFTTIAFLFDAQPPFAMHVTMIDGASSYPDAPPTVQLASLAASETMNGRTVPLHCRLQALAVERSTPPAEVAEAIRSQMLEALPDFLAACQAHMPKPLN